jgi:hypothetical protein
LHAPTAASKNLCEDPSRPATGPTEIIAKRVQTRAQQRPFAVNEARLSLTRG